MATTTLCNSALPEQGQKEYPPHRHTHVVTTKEVDAGAQIVVGLSTRLDPAEAARIRKKIDYYILPMMCMLYWIQFMDKTTLGSAAILGIVQGTHLSTNQYNWLGTIFYLGYFVFEYPQNLALQRFPVGRWMSINILVWGVSLICQAACTNFSGLFVCRLLLGMCEGSITAGFMIVSSMFYTRKEQTLRVGYWFLMNGTAQIISGFISFGTLHIRTIGFAPWQWLMVITGIITLAIAIVYWFFFPDSPINAWFLTPSERATAVQRLKENQTGVGNKHFKRQQMMEALLDPKTWLFALFSALITVPNSLTNQRQIIVSSFGFDYLQTTLLGCVDGLIEIMSIWTGVTLAARISNGRAYVGAMYFIPSLIGVLMIELLPWSNQVGLLLCIWLIEMNGATFVLSLSWLTNVTAGHTKRITTNAIMLSAYCIGNAVGPFMWQARYKPRNQIPWIVIGVCYLTCPILLLTIRRLLAHENARRDVEPREEEEQFFIEKVSEDGKRMQLKVDKVWMSDLPFKTRASVGRDANGNLDKEFMDLTDRQNRDFRYVL